MHGAAGCLMISQVTGDARTDRDAETDQLRTALGAYVERAIVTLGEACDETVVGGTTGTSRWERASSDMFVLRESVEPGWQLCIALNEERLSDLPEYEAALAAIESDEAAARHADTLVGTALSAHRIEKTALVNRMIWLVARRTGGLRFDTTACAEAYEEFRRDLDAANMEEVVVAPIVGLRGPSDPIQVAEGMELGPLNDDEIADCLRMGIVRSPFGSETVAVGVGSTQGRERTEIATDSRNERV